MTALVPSIRRGGLVSRPAWDVFDRFFEGFGWPSTVLEERGWTPPLDVSETEKDLIVRFEIPGMDKDDINISLSAGVLTVSGEKKAETVENESCHCMESYHGRFSRSLSLPFEVDSDKVDATFKNGVLRITLPKSEATRTRHIEVKG